MNKTRVKTAFVTLLIIIMPLACTSPTSTPKVSDNIEPIQVQKTQAIEKRSGTEEFSLPNCGGTSELSQSLGTQTSVKKGVVIGTKASISVGGEVEIPLAAKLKLEAAVELAYQQDYEAATSRLDTIVMKAAPSSHVIYVIQWDEQRFESIVAFGGNEETYEASYSYVLRIPKISDSYQVSCPTTAKDHAAQTATAERIAADETATAVARKADAAATAAEAARETDVAGTATVAVQQTDAAATATEEARQTAVAVTSAPTCPPAVKAEGLFTVGSYGDALQMDENGQFVGPVVDAIEEFQSHCTGVEVLHFALTASELLSTLQTGQIDVLCCFSTTSADSYVERGVLRPLEDYLSETYGTLEAYRYRGQIYGLYVDLGAGRTGIVTVYVGSPRPEVAVYFAEFLSK